MSNELLSDGNLLSPEIVRIGSRLKTYRLLLNFTLNQVAEKVGISFQQIQKYETGKNQVPISRLKSIANFYGVDISAFFDDEVYKKTIQNFISKKTSTAADPNTEIVLNFDDSASKRIEEMIIDREIYKYLEKISDIDTKKLVLNMIKKFAN